MSAKVPVPHLQSLGWFDFLNNDRPETSDAIEMGAIAFMYLSLEDDGSWNGQIAVLTSILAFLHGRTGKQPTSVDLADFKSLLTQTPVRPDEVRGWFERVYR